MLLGIGILIGIAVCIIFLIVFAAYMNKCDDCPLKQDENGKV